MNQLKIRMFLPLSATEEAQLLNRGGLAWRRYLTNLVEMILIKHGVSARTRPQLRRRLIHDAPSVLERFRAISAGRYKFSTFFSWHVRGQLKRLGWRISSS